MVTELDMMMAGVDEAGRGPLAGPVVAAAVILNPVDPIQGLADSKQLSAKKRARLFDEIQDRAVAFSIIEVHAVDIDRLNILQATLWGMAQAIESLDPKPDRVRVDGNQAPPVNYPIETLVGGDALDPAISAASILAKVHRDRWMEALAKSHPEYGFDRHKGYPTAQHLEALTRHGPTDAHRKTFKPVIRALEAHQSLL